MSFLVDHVVKNNPPISFYFITDRPVIAYTSTK